MAKKEKSKSGKSGKSSSAASAKSEATSHVVANTRLVAAIKLLEESKKQTQTYLVEVATIVQEEQLTRAEVVASLMEAKGIEKSSAESQYSRMKKLLNDPDLLEELKEGDIDLKTAREKSTTKQKNPSAKKKAESIEKRFAKALTTIVQCAKEGGMDRETVMNTVKTALKKNGIK